MRYLKLFEAFESEKLTKTLGYVDKKSREELVKTLKTICSSFDFPFSQLNDSQFQYLPYQKAINLQYVSKETPCKATSKSEFGGHGIEGETCQSGKIKRMWGTRQRIVDCPNCGGTGIQPERSEIKILKFWFTKQGEMVTVTGVDNTTKPQIKGKKTLFSKNISDYNITGDIVTRRSDISFLNNGDFVLAQLNNGGNEMICYVLKEGRRLYLIQDEHDGDTPNSDYRGIARYSWNITDGDFIRLRKVEPKIKKDDNEEEQEIDPFSFNKAISIGYRGSINFDRYRDIESLVQKAHFALVFNLESLKTEPFKTKSEIGRERTEIKSGSRLTIKDSDVKKANIERYMREIALRSDIISDVSNLPKVVKRFLGGENILFFMIYNSRFTDHIYKLSDLYSRALLEGDDDYYKKRLSEYIAERYKTMTSYNSTINDNIKFIKENSKGDEVKRYLDILDGLEQLSKKLYQKISQMPIECVEDLDIVKAKLDSIRQIFRSSRYNFDRMDYFIDSLTTSINSENAFRYLTNHYYIRDYRTEILKGIEQANKVLDRF
jgi:hypothetical protein